MINYKFFFIFPIFDGKRLNLNIIKLDLHEHSDLSEVISIPNISQSFSHNVIFG